MLDWMHSRCESVSETPGMPILLNLPAANTSTFKPAFLNASESSMIGWMTPMEPTRALGVT